MPSPFLARYLLEWFVTQTMSRAQEAVVQEVKSRVESGDLGDYDGILFKDGVKAKSEGARIEVDSVDLGVVGATKRELVGLIDKMGVPKTTQGNSFKYYTGTWKGARIAIVETGVGLERARQGAEALLQAFRPKRVAAIGFATRLIKTIEDPSLFIPNRLLLEDSSELDLNPPTLPKPDVQTTRSASVQEKGTEPLDSADDAKLEQESEPSVDASENASSSPKIFAREFLRRAATGALASVEREPKDKESRRALRERTGAVAYDRGLFAVAQACVAVGVPFLPLLVVRKPESLKIPRDAAKLTSGNSGSVARSLGAFLGAVTRRPSVALDVYKLKEDSLAAADKLADAIGVVLNAAKAKSKESA